MRRWPAYRSRPFRARFPAIPSVSEETRARVLAAAEQLNYKVDKNASGLRPQHSRTLAVLFFEEAVAEGALINPFYLSMLGPMVRCARDTGYDLLISFQQLSSDWHVDYEDSRKADGIILLGYGDYLEYWPKLEALIERGTHFVRWGSAGEGALGATVSSDNEQGGFDATSICCSRAGAGSRSSAPREPGYPGIPRALARLLPGLARRGHRARTNLRVDAEPSEAGGRAAVEELLGRGAEFDAVFAASDVAAIGAMHALQKVGRAVPADVAIVGFDDIPAASLSSPPLTTVTQDARQAGRSLIEASDRGGRNGRMPQPACCRCAYGERVERQSARAACATRTAALGRACGAT